eukprot:6198476-Pleurochrysis_carterae.AAC.1
MHAHMHGSGGSGGAKCGVQRGDRSIVALDGAPSKTTRWQCAQGRRVGRVALACERVARGVRARAHLLRREHRLDGGAVEDGLANAQLGQDTADAPDVHLVTPFKAEHHLWCAVPEVGTNSVSRTQAHESHARSTPHAQQPTHGRPKSARGRKTSTATREIQAREARTERQRRQGQ